MSRSPSCCFEIFDILNFATILLRGLTCCPSAADIRPHRSNRKLAPAHDRIDNPSCNQSTLSLTGCQHRTTAPAVAPQLIAGMATLAVLHHDEPALQSLGMADSACRHLSCRCLKHLLYEHRAVGETSVRAIGGDGPGRCIDDVELL